MNNALTLRQIIAKCFRRAKAWYAAYLCVQLLVLAFAVVALFVNLDPYASALVGLILVVLSEGLRWRSDMWKSEAERFKREWEQCDGFGLEVNAAVIADWVASKPPGFLDDVKEQEVSGSEFDSQEPPGPRRAVENTQESAWWTKHECRRMSVLLLIGLGVLLVVGFGTLLVNVAFLRDAPAHAPGDIAILRSVGGIVCAIFTIVFSINVVRLFTEFRELAAQAEDVFGKCSAQLLRADIPERDAWLLMHEYQNARSAAPLIPTRIWLARGAHLRAEWRRFRPRA